MDKKTLKHWIALNKNAQQDKEFELADLKYKTEVITRDLEDLKLTGRIYQCGLDGTEFKLDFKLDFPSMSDKTSPTDEDKVDGICPRCQSRMELDPICLPCRMIWLNGFYSDEKSELIEGQIDPMLSGFFNVDWKVDAVPQTDK